MKKITDDAVEGDLDTFIDASDVVMDSLNVLDSSLYVSSQRTQPLARDRYTAGDTSGKPEQSLPDAQLAALPKRISRIYTPTSVVESFNSQPSGNVPQTTNGVRDSIYPSQSMRTNNVTALMQQRNDRILAVNPSSMVKSTSAPQADVSAEFLKLMGVAITQDVQQTLQAKEMPSVRDVQNYKSILNISGAKQKDRTGTAPNIQSAYKAQVVKKSVSKPIDYSTISKFNTIKQDAKDTTPEKLNIDIQTPPDRSKDLDKDSLLRYTQRMRANKVSVIGDTGQLERARIRNVEKTLNELIYQSISSFSGIKAPEIFTADTPIANTTIEQSQLADRDDGSAFSNALPYYRQEQENNAISSALNTINDDRDKERKLLLIIEQNNRQQEAKFSKMLSEYCDEWMSNDNF